MEKTRKDAGKKSRIKTASEEDLDCLGRVLEDGECYVGNVVRDTVKLFDALTSKLAGKRITEVIMGIVRMFDRAFSLDPKYQLREVSTVRHILRCILDCPYSSPDSGHFFVGVGQGKPKAAVEEALKSSKWKKGMWATVGLTFYVETNFGKNFDNSRPPTSLECFNLPGFNDVNDLILDTLVDISDLPWTEFCVYHNPSLKRGEFYVMILFKAVTLPRIWDRYHVRADERDEENAKATE